MESVICALCTLAVVAACCVPLEAQAQAEVLVFLDEASPLRASFEVELAARGWRAVFVAPDADPVARTGERGAIGSLWLEERAAPSLTLRAFRTDRGTSASLVVDDVSADPRMLAVVAAAMLEELLSHHEVVEPEPEVRRAPVQFPLAFGMYTGVEMGAWLRLTETPTAHASVRVSVGLQWGDGFRIGLMMLVTGYELRDWSGTRPSSTMSGGLESGVRLGDGLWAFHVGGQALVGQSGLNDGVVDVEVHVGGYVGAGLWAYRRVELGLRLSAEASIIPSWQNTAVLTLALRAEFR